MNRRSVIKKMEELKLWRVVNFQLEDNSCRNTWNYTDLKNNVGRRIEGTEVDILKYFMEMDKKELPLYMSKSNIVYRIFDVFPDESLVLDSLSEAVHQLVHARLRGD